MRTVDEKWKLFVLFCVGKFWHDFLDSYKVRLILFQGIKGLFCFWFYTFYLVWIEFCQPRCAFHISLWVDYGTSSSKVIGLNPRIGRWGSLWKKVPSLRVFSYFLLPTMKSVVYALWHNDPHSIHSLQGCTAHMLRLQWKCVAFIGDGNLDMFWKCMKNNPTWLGDHSHSFCCVDTRDWTLDVEVESLCPTSWANWTSLFCSYEEVVTWCKKGSTTGCDIQTYG